MYRAGRGCFLPTGMVPNRNVQKLSLTVAPQKKSRMYVHNQINAYNGAHCLIARGNEIVDTNRMHSYLEALRLGK